MLRASLLRPRPLVFGGTRTVFSCRYQSGKRAGPSIVVSQKYSQLKKNKNPPAIPSNGKTPNNSSHLKSDSSKSLPIPPQKILNVEENKPIDSGSSSTSQEPAPRKSPKKKRHLGRFLVLLLVLCSVGYGGGVYYSLENDAWHGIFTRYVPFAEDAVDYLEEREFRRRFLALSPSRTPSHMPSDSDTKVNIRSHAGMSPREADKEPHLSGPVENQESSKGHLGKENMERKKIKENLGRNINHSSRQAKNNEADKGDKDDLNRRKVDEEKATENRPKMEKLIEGSSKYEPLRNGKDTEPVTTHMNEKNHTFTASLIDSLQTPNEPLVQEVVKTFDSIISAINSGKAPEEYGSIIAKVTQDFAKVISNIQNLRERAEKLAEEKIQTNKVEFDNAAQALVKQMEREIVQIQTKWRDDYETEREKLAKSYSRKLQEELLTTEKLNDQKLKNALLEQAILLKRDFARNVSERVESERSGRLSKLDELSREVQEMSGVIKAWKEVLDENLQNQRLLVAVEAIQSKLENAREPTPFVLELAALKKVAESSPSSPVIAAAIAGLPPWVYQCGIPTRAQLVARFGRVVDEIRKASLVPADADHAGLVSHAASLVMSKTLIWKRRGDVPGEDTEAVLARTEQKLVEGDVEGAAREVNGLQGWGKVLAVDWLREARGMGEVALCLDIISTEARLQSLLLGNL